MNKEEEAPANSSQGGDLGKKQLLEDDTIQNLEQQMTNKVDQIEQTMDGIQRDLEEQKSERVKFTEQFYEQFHQKFRQEKESLRSSLFSTLQSQPVSPSSSVQTSLSSLGNSPPTSRRVQLHNSKSEENSRLLQGYELSHEQKIHDEDTVYLSLKRDTYSMMMISSPFSYTWIFAFVIFLLQLGLFLMILAEQINQSKGSSMFNVPFRVSPFVRFGQFLAILTLLTLQDDIIEATNIISLFTLNDAKDQNIELFSTSTSSLVLSNNYDNVTTTTMKEGTSLAQTSISKEHKWNIIMSNICKFICGLFSLTTSFIIIVSSADIIDLFKDFAALTVISFIDNASFRLCIEGIFGTILQAYAVGASTVKLKQQKDSKHQKHRRYLVAFVTLCMYFVWGVYVRGQISHSFFYAKYPNCPISGDDISRIGNGECDGGLYNRVECDFDGLDCINFNIGYPSCNAISPTELSNGYCEKDNNTTECRYDGGDCCPNNNEDEVGSEDDEKVCRGGSYNSEACNFDNGRCNKFNKLYPNCKHVPDPWRVGDGYCDGSVYMSDECLGDGGDCTGCSTDDPSRVGDGVCDSEFNKIECSYDSGDCEQFNLNYPDCKNVTFPNKVGDGICDGKEYNAKACEFDGGDCIKFNTQYPLCREAHEPEKVGDGNCNAEYNNEECSWDGGDCIIDNLPDCHVNQPDRVGDGHCDDEYNNYECAYDSGDCCFVDDPSKLGDGTCQGGQYNTAECSYDNGDCLIDELPDCHVERPAMIGDGVCQEAFNTPECNYDKGDCDWQIDPTPSPASDVLMLTSNVEVRYYMADSWVQLPTTSNGLFVLPQSSSKNVDSINFTSTAKMFPGSERAALFQGHLHFPSSGDYQLCIGGGPGEWKLYLDNSLLLENNQLLIEDTKCSNITMPWHTGRNVRVEYLKVGEAAELVCSWLTPGSLKKSIIPSTAWHPIPKNVQGLYFELAGHVDHNTDVNLLEIVPYKQESLTMIDFSEHDGDFLGSGRKKWFGALFQGYLLFPMRGEYRLCVNNKDRVRVSIDYTILIDFGIDQEGVKCSSRPMHIPGVHTVLIEYIEPLGNASLILSWQTPNSDEVVPIPPSAFVLPKYISIQYYEANPFWTKLPPTGLSGLTSYKKEYISMIDFLPSSGEFGGSGRANNVAALIRGYLVFAFTGNYTLCITSDDGSRLFINNELLVDNDGLHLVKKECADIEVPHPIIKLVTVEYFDRSGESTLTVSWQTPIMVTDMPINPSFFLPNLYVKLQAEDHLGQGSDGTSVANDIKGYEGSGYITFTTAEYSYIEWQLNTPFEGEIYYITFRYAANYSSSENRKLQLSLDGVLKGTISFYGNSGGSVWLETKSFPVVLTKNSKHYIRLTTTGNYGPDVDYLQWELGTKPIEIRLLLNNQCIGQTIDGNAKVFVCDGTQQWGYDSNKKNIISLENGKCLHWNQVADNSIMMECDGSDNQKWFFSNKLIRSIEGDDCLQLWYPPGDEDIYENNNLEVFKCDATNVNQQFEFVGI